MGFIAGFQSLSLSVSLSVCLSLSHPHIYIYIYIYDDNLPYKTRRVPVSTEIHAYMNVSIQRVMVSNQNFLIIAVISRIDFNQENPVHETHFGRLWYKQPGSGWVCLVTGRTPSLKGSSPQALTFLGGVRCIA